MLNLKDAAKYQGKIVKVVRDHDGKEFQGEARLTEDREALAFYTGKRGRPGTVRRSQVRTISLVQAAAKAEKKTAAKPAPKKAAKPKAEAAPAEPTTQEPTIPTETAPVVGGAEQNLAVAS